MNKIKKIGLLGGSFNPPHSGHEAVIRDLLAKSIFDEIWLVPVFKHPFGKDLVAFDHRIAMLSLLCKALGVPNQLVICTAERDANLVPSYTHDLVAYLIKHYPQYLFSLILGSDTKAQFSQWHRSEELEKMVSLYFIPRQGYEASPYPDISSTDVRKKIWMEKDTDNLTLPSIRNYILQNNLYRT